MTEAELPEVEWGGHIIDSLMEFGPAAHGMSGPVPVSFQEIESWSRMTNTFVPTYEALVLRGMSIEYCNQYYKSIDPSCPRPAEDPETIAQRVQQQLAALMRANG